MWFLFCFSQKYHIQKYSNLNHSFAPVRIMQKLEAAWVYSKEDALVRFMRFYEGLVDNFHDIFIALIFPN